MSFPLARTGAEAHLFMDLRPCRCGETQFPRQSAVVMVGGELVTRYAGRCAQCGLDREFVFRLPEDILPQQAGADVVFGGPQPSELLDPGEWLQVADRQASQVPMNDATRNDRAARLALATALAAVDEVLKFIPDRADAVPAESFRTYPGQTLYGREPGRFRRARLLAVREAYRDLLA
jgi:hypothetical protein